MKKTVLSFVFLLLVIQSATAQLIMKRIEADGSDIVMITELGAILTGQDNTVNVKTLLPVEARPEEYRNIKIKEGDEILMVNSKRIKSAKTFEELYKSAKIGETIKLGISRNKEMLIVSFEKADPQKLPPQRQIIIKQPGPGEDAEEKLLSENKIVLHNPDGRIKPLFSEGFILEDFENHVKISKILPLMKDTLGEIDIQEGDVVVAVNGQKVQSHNEFFSVYDKIEVGSKVTLNLKRKTKKLNVSYKKPEEKSQIIIKK